MTAPFATVAHETPAPGQEAFQVGDVFEDGGELVVVDYVNDCRARRRPVLGVTVEVNTRFHGKASFERHQDARNVAVMHERGVVLERLGRDGLEKFLASQTAQRRGAVDGEQETTTKETTERILDMAAKLRKLKGEKKSGRKPRGGLAADMAADQTAAGAAPVKEKRTRKATAPAGVKVRGPRGVRVEFIKGLLDAGKSGDEIWTETKAKFTYSDRKTVDGLVDKIKASPVVAA